MRSWGPPEVVVIRLTAFKTKTSRNQTWGQRTPAQTPDVIQEMIRVNINEISYKQHYKQPREPIVSSFWGRHKKKLTFHPSFAFVAEHGASVPSCLSVSHISAEKINQSLSAAEEEKRRPASTPRKHALKNTMGILMGYRQTSSNKGFDNCQGLKFLQTSKSWEL